MPERPILMTPGPTEIPLQVLQAMVKPSIVHHDPAFNVEVLDRTLIDLRKVFQTENEVIAMPGSGRTALEAAITSVIDKGDRVLCVVAGVFGGWMKEMVDRIGGEGVLFEFEWGRSIDLKALDATLRGGKFKALTIVHNETSAGTAYPIQQIGEMAVKHEVLYLVDTVSSLGGVDIRTDAWGIDLNMTASHKCLAAPLGVALNSISSRAWEVMERRRTPAASFSLDLLRWKKMWLPPDRGGELIYGWRRQPVSMPVHAVYALHEATNLILEEGLENRFRRHRISARAMRAAVGALGLELFADRAVWSDTLTCVKLPETVPAKETIRIMKEEHGIVVAGGLPPRAENNIRIGHMGLTASPMYIFPTIAALEATLSSLGYKFHRGQGLEAAEEAFGQDK